MPFFKNSYFLKNSSEWLEIFLYGTWQSPGRAGPRPVTSRCGLWWTEGAGGGAVTSRTLGTGTASLARWPIQAPIAQVGDSAAGRPAAHNRFEERILVNAR